MKPSVLRSRESVQLSYDLPHRIFCSKVYPRRASNGSSVIIYGHEQGIRVLWYGGRHFKPKEQSHTPPAVNGASKTEPMVIDLDDDEPKDSQKPTKSAEFEDEDPEIDPARPYRDILRYIDIPLGTSVTHLVFPHLSGDIERSSSDTYPSLLTSHITLAAACVDLSIRLITLPLTPPSQDSTEFSSWDVRIVKIFGPNTHQDLISGLALTYTADSADFDGNLEQSKSRSRSRDALTANPSKPKPSQKWTILLASTSCTGNGMLLIHQIPISSDPSFKPAISDLMPIQRQYLRSSLSNCSLSFNPSSYPTERHSNLLITLPSRGCVKVYQVFSPSSSRGRRGSTTTIDSTTSSSRSARGSALLHGKFLITLYSSFIASTSDPFPRRKQVLDSSWVLGGKAIIALLEDGEWGVWDLEATGPSSASTAQNLVQGQGNVSGIQGGSLTKFAVKGMFPSSSDSASAMTVGVSQNPKSRDLMPMTPHTRKLRSDGLFQGGNSKPSLQSDEAIVPFGTVSVTEHPATAASTSKLKDESVIMSLMDISIYIPSILAYWRAETSGRGSLDTSNSTRPSIIPTLKLGGEQQRSISILNQPSQSSVTGLFAHNQIYPDLVVSTNRRLIMLVSPISEPPSADSNVNMFTLPTRSLVTLPLSTSADQALLTHGQLDVEGMDRILEGMANDDVDDGNNLSASVMGILGKKVGFAVDKDYENDVDMEMGTPTAKRIGVRMNSSVNKSGAGSRSGPRGRVFS